MTRACPHLTDPSSVSLVSSESGCLPAGRKHEDAGRVHDVRSAATRRVHNATIVANKPRDTRPLLSWVHSRQHRAIPGHPPPSCLPTPHAPEACDDSASTAHRSTHTDSPQRKCNNPKQAARTLWGHRPARQALSSGRHSYAPGCGSPMCANTRSTNCRAISVVLCGWLYKVGIAGKIVAPASATRVMLRR